MCELYMPMTKMQKLRTVDAVVAAFGGTVAAAQWAGHGKSAISNWLEREFIPPGWHYRMSKWALEHGYEIDHRVFGEERPKKRRGANQPAA